MRGVYKVPCLPCPAVYIGETSRRLGTRIDEHKKDGDKINQQKLSCSQKQNLNKRATNRQSQTMRAEKNHVIDWKGTRLIARESRNCTSRIREAIRIKRTPNNMNRDGGAYQLSDICDTAIAKTTTPGDGQIGG